VAVVLGLLIRALITASNSSPLLLSDNSHGPPECNQGWVLFVDTEIKCAAFVKQEVSDIRVKTPAYVGSNI
jgi:hypothetical protein